MNVNIPEKLSRLPFSGDPRSNLTAGASKQLDRDAVLPLKFQHQGIAQSSGDVRNHRYLAFSFRCSEGALPFGCHAHRVKATEWCGDKNSTEHKNAEVHDERLIFAPSAPIYRRQSEGVNPSRFTSPRGGGM